MIVATPIDTDPAANILRQLELTVTRRLAGLLHGDYQGVLPSTGSELADTQKYEPGDDVRRIDWAATARSQTVQMRTTLEDRELTVYVVVDATGSMDFGTVTTSKRYMGAAATAAFTFLAARGANRVGGAIFTGGQWKWFKPRSGRDAARSLVHAALTVSEEGAGDLADALQRTARSAVRRGLVVVISDFAGPLDWEQPLRSLSANHDLVVVEIVDPREQELVNAGVVTFENPETGNQYVVDTANKQLRDSYAQARVDHRIQIKDIFLSAMADHLVLATGGDVPNPQGKGFDAADGTTWLDQFVVWLRLRRRGLTTPWRRP